MIDHEPKAPSSIEQALSTETQVLITAFTELRDRLNINNPDDLPQDDEDVANAIDDHINWVVLVDRKAAEIATPEANEEANFLKTAFFTEAGFTDRVYLIEVLDWLDQDEYRASQMGLDELAAKIRSKIKEIIDLLER